MTVSEVLLGIMSLNKTKDSSRNYFINIFFIVYFILLEKILLDFLE